MIGISYNSDVFKKIIISVTCVVLLSMIAYFNATRINPGQLQIREETIVSPKIDEDTDGLLIAFFSDLYYGEFVKEEELQKTIDTILSFQPDVIIFGGDLCTEDCEREYLLSCLSSLKATYGKYAVTGELDDERNKTILEEAGFVLLNDKHNSIDIDRNSYINLIGLSDLNHGQPDPVNAFAGVDTTRYTIVVSHAPDLFNELDSYQFDYMLAGHSLGGQIYFPIIDLFFRPEGAKKYFKGKVTVSNKTIDITNGVGRTKKDARLLSDGEIVLYTLRSAK